MLFNQIPLFAQTSIIFSSTSGISTDYQNPALKAAGSLIYAIDPEDGKTYVLLSKEAIWGGRNSGKWKGFGGRKEPYETLIETALRETNEESRGVINYPLKNVPFEHLLAIEHYHCKYLQLCLPIEFDPTLPEQFQNAQIDDPHFNEKTEICWIPFEELMRAIQAADREARQRGCTPYEVDVAIEFDGKTFPLGRDFTETMVILVRESSDPLDLLVQPKGSSLLISDKEWK